MSSFELLRLCGGIFVNGVLLRLPVSDFCKSDFFPNLLLFLNFLFCCGWCKVGPREKGEFLLCDL